MLAGTWELAATGSSLSITWPWYVLFRRTSRGLKRRKPQGACMPRPLTECSRTLPFPPESEQPGFTPMSSLDIWMFPFDFCNLLLNIIFSVICFGWNRPQAWALERVRLRPVGIACSPRQLCAQLGTQSVAS